MRRSVFLLAGLIVAIAQFIAPTAARAQERGASGHRLSGSVRDTLGRPLPGVNVTLQAADGHVVATAKSNDQGEFSFPNVPPGTYAAVGETSPFHSLSGSDLITCLHQQHRRRKRDRGSSRQ